MEIFLKKFGMLHNFGYHARTHGWKKIAKLHGCMFKWSAFWYFQSPKFEKKKKKKKIKLPDLCT
jgi:hypothetical protein